jgi:Carboxypeptidase regulatory-like domain
MIRAYCRKLQLLVFLLTVFVASWVFLSFPLAAQTTFGSITGRVTDPTGAVIPQALVTVTNEGTGATRQVTAGSTGTFNVPDLGVGVYKIHIEAAGFKAYDQAEMNLNANQVLGVNARLVLASDTSTVEVEGSASVSNTETSTLAYPKDNCQPCHAPQPMLAYSATFIPIQEWRSLVRETQL